MEFINEVVCNDPYVDVNVRKVIEHPKYKKEYYDQLNDIALLELESNVKFTEFIKPICLPNDLRIRKMDFTGHSMEVSGFKLHPKSNEDTSPTKKVYFLNVVEQDKCRAHYAKMKIDVTNTQICAGIQTEKEFW